MHQDQDRLRLKQKNRPRSAYRKRRRRRILRRAVLSACVAVLICGAFLLGSYILRLKNAADVNAELSAIRAEDAALDQTEGVRIYADADDSAEENQAVVTSAQKKSFQYVGTEILNECRSLYKLNPDLVGWLSVPGELDLPVVYRDNEYYLTHDFYGRENDSGTVFLDADHPFEEETQYLFLHGHNVWDGSMLGNLTHYRNTDYIKENPYLYFNTLYRRETYEIFGVMKVSQEEMYGLMRLGTPGFENGAEFNSFIETLRRHALRFTDKQLSPDDAILALSTCWEDERIVVLFRRVDRSAE